MIHYSATTSSGGSIRYAFQGSMGNGRDVELALVHGADMAGRIIGYGGGHNIHDGNACECSGRPCESVWTERPGTVWEKRGFRWHVKKESK